MITKLQTSRPLYHSDGLRAFGPNKLVMAEGETKGFLDLITIDGDKAKTETIEDDGYEGPVSLAQVGDTIYVLDTPLKYLPGPEAKKKIHAAAVQGVSGQSAPAAAQIATPTPDNDVDGHQGKRKHMEFKRYG